MTVDDAREILAAIPGLTGIGGDLNIDGSLGSRTAALRAPYADAPGTTGVLYLTAEQICNHLTAVTRAGVQGGFHVIGDRAMDELLLGLRAAVDVEGPDAIARRGHRLEHAEMVDAPTLAALVLLGVRLSVQPAFDAAWGGPDGMYATRLGAGRAAALNPLADLAAAGVPLAFGSDSPVTADRPVGGRARRGAAPRGRPADLGAGGVPGLDPRRLAARRPRPHGRRRAARRVAGPPRRVARRAPDRAGGRRPVLVVEHRRARRDPAAARHVAGRARAGVPAHGPRRRRPARHVLTAARSGGPTG